MCNLASWRSRLQVDLNSRRIPGVAVSPRDVFEGNHSTAGNNPTYPFAEKLALCVGVGSWSRFIKLLFTPNSAKLLTQPIKICVSFPN